MHQNGNGNAPLVSEQVELPPDTDSQPWLRVLETEMAAAQMAARLKVLDAQMGRLNAERDEVAQALYALNLESEKAQKALRDALTTHYARRTSWQ